MKQQTRKAAAVLLAAVLLLALTGCGGTPPLPGSSEPASSGAVPSASAALPMEEAAFSRQAQAAVACLSECDRELYGAQVDWQTILFAAYAREGDTAPAALYPVEEAVPEGLLSDPAAASYYPVSNFTSLDEVRASLAPYLTPALLEEFAPRMADNFLEYEGKLYLKRGGRGYGTLHCLPETLAYLGEEDGFQVGRIDYQIFDEYDHTARLYFEDGPEGFRLARVEELEAVG